MCKMNSTTLAFFAILVACGSWPAFALSAEPKSAATSKWEYRVVAKAELLELSQKKDLTAALNVLGDDGWELAAIDGAVYIFKRAKPSPSQIEDAKRRVSQAEADIQGWKDRVAWSERMVKKGYLTERHLQEEQALLQAAEIALDKARKELKALSPEPKPEK